MAKNKNRKQNSDLNRASVTEETPEQSRSAAPDSRSSDSPLMGSPSDVARKHQKRFGHN
ncbi:hypothetical protein [Streptomyces sp. NPDC046939]|uniref:hypothetical protein n=1 Tax=Streptomyces sp. NPDC046939 TaxID=3155376 RepID=UPI0033E5B2B4